jgi:DDE superfamily endonuclease
MNLKHGGDSEPRFAAYVEGLASVIDHADRTGPLRDYCTGLMLPGERKSVEPMAARTAPARTADIRESACEEEAASGHVSPFELRVWRTIDLGIYQDADALREALNRAPYLSHIDYRANEIAGRIAFSHADTKLDLVMTTVSALGLGEHGASLGDIFARASLCLLPSTARRVSAHRNGAGRQLSRQDG